MEGERKRGEGLVWGTHVGVVWEEGDKGDEERATGVDADGVG